MVGGKWWILPRYSIINHHILSYAQAEREKLTAGETTQQGHLATPPRLTPSSQRSVRPSPTNTKNCVLDQGVAYYRGTERETQREGRGERLGAKSGPGKDGCQLGPPVSISDLSILPFVGSLHPAPSSFPAAGWFSPQQRKAPLMARTETSVCAFKTKNRVSLNSPWIHTRCLLSPSFTSSSLSKPLAPFLLSPRSPYHPPTLHYFPWFLLRFPSSTSAFHSAPSLSLLPAVAPPRLFGPAFQSSFNWTWGRDNRSRPPGEVDMCRDGALPTPTGLHSQQWLAAGC